MSTTTFTMPGKLGDAILQWPVAWAWARQTGKTFDLWLDEKTCGPLVQLFAAQPCVREVKLIGGVENWSCGGQPFHFNLPTAAFEDRVIYHLGFRSFPARQITLETFASARVPVTCDQELLSQTPVFHVQPRPANGSRVVLHGQPVYTHNRSNPGFWKFLARIRPYLESRFSEIVWVGNERDREVGRRTYPDWSEFDDGGDFLKLAELIAGAELVLGVGSSVVTLGGALMIPTVRVHDPIGEAPRQVWDNLAANSLNRSEIELRSEWPKFRDKWLARNPVATAALNAAEVGL